MAVLRTIHVKHGQVQSGGQFTLQATSAETNVADSTLNNLMLAPWFRNKLAQAQRDYFGAHTYERTDRPRGQFFHTEWLTARD